MKKILLITLAILFLSSCNKEHNKRQVKDFMDGCPEQSRFSISYNIGFIRGMTLTCEFDYTKEKKEQMIAAWNGKVN